jgi:putative membrane protein
VTWWCSATGVPWTWAWRAYPGVWLVVIAVAVGGELVLRRAAARRGHGAGAGQAAAFAGGVLALWIALDWPVGALGAGYLLSAHTLQYLLLTFAAAPLLLIGLRREAGDGARLPAAHPIAALLVYNLVLGATHVPQFVDGLMKAQAGAAVADLAWFAAGLVLWWPVLHPDPARRLSPPASIGYLVASTVLPTIPAAFLVFASYPLYSIYELAPRIVALTPLQDQQLAGMIMKLGADPILWLSTAVIFFRWQAARDAEEADPVVAPTSWGAPPASP